MKKIVFCKKKGLTLIEMVVTIALISILIGIGFNVLQSSTVNSNEKFKQESDLQNGVNITMDKIKGILKNATQVHIVGDEVYSIGQKDYSGIDDRFSYIIKYKDEKTGTITLANMIPRKKKNEKDKASFDIYPIVSSDLKDDIGKIKYDIQVYENEKDYNKKMTNKLLNLTVKGIYLDNKGNEKDKFSLNEDMILSNTNQIMLSKFLEDDINKFTAIAYDTTPKVATEKEVAPQKIAIVFVLDNSGSMRFTMNYLQLNPMKDDSGSLWGDNGKMYYTIHNEQGDYIVKRNHKIRRLNGRWEYSDDDIKSTFGGQLEEKTCNKSPYSNLKWRWVCKKGERNPYSFPIIAESKSDHGTDYKWKKPSESDLGYGKYRKFQEAMEDPLFAPRNVIVGKVMEGTMMSAFKGLVDKKVSIYAYAFNYNDDTIYGSGRAEKSGKYLFPIEKLTKEGYGPYLLNDGETNGQRSKFVSRIKVTLKMSYQGQSLQEYYDPKRPPDRDNQYASMGTTNTGSALLQALDMLNQINDVDHKFLVFLSDGIPTNYKLLIKPGVNLSEKDFKKTNKNDKAMEYIEIVTDPKQGHNSKTTYKKAFCIGLSAIEKDKSKMRQIQNYLSRSGNKVEYIDAKDKKSLEEGFKNIVKTIEKDIKTELFEGPRKKLTN